MEKMYLPETVNYEDELDQIYARELKQVSNNLQFYGFLKRWKYWLDPEVRTLSGFDWKWMERLLQQCRELEDCPSDKHKIAMALAMPQRIVYVTAFAQKRSMPWGTAYLHLKNKKVITW
jgi:hypothetical protein